MRVAMAAAVGGAGATRLAVECGAALARDGRDAIVLDAAFGTQGLVDHLPAAVTPAPDLTTLMVEGQPLAAGTYELACGPGRLAICPARGPFERVARAMTTDAAHEFERLLETATDAFEHVVLDVPPTVGNQVVAALTGADHVATVTPATARGAAALPRLRDRLADLGVDGPTSTVCNRVDAAGSDATAEDGTTHGIAATVALPTSSVTRPAACPVLARARTAEERDAGQPTTAVGDPVDDAPFPTAVAAATERLFDVDLTVTFDDGSLGLLG